MPAIPLPFARTRRLPALLTAAFATLLLAAPAARAHDLVLVPAATPSGPLTVRYGHPGDWQRIEDGKLIEVQVYAGGDAAAVDQRAALKPRGLDKLLPASAVGSRNAVAGGGAVLVAGRYDNGLWSRLPPVGDAKPNARNTTRLLLPDAQTVTANLKFAKAVYLARGDETVYQRRLGHLLELLPQRNPATVASGEALPVLLLLDGKPLAGAGIEVGNGRDAIPEDRIRRYVTDAAGIAQVMLRPHGVNTLAVDVDRPNDGSLGERARALPADRLVLIATYSFVLR